MKTTIFGEPVSNLPPAEPTPLTDSWMASTHSAPAQTYVTVLDMDAEFMPADVAHHREINKTTGQESEA